MSKKKYCYADFETQSATSFQCGAYLYVTHPSTRPMAFGFKYAGKHYMITQQYFRDDGGFYSFYELQQAVQVLKALANDPDVVFVFHNAFFDYWVWMHHMVKLGFPLIPISRIKCTMAKCYAHSIPPSLKMAASVLKLEHQKDMVNQQNMLFLSRPLEEILPSVWSFPMETDSDYALAFRLMYQYCESDIDAMEELDHFLRDLTPTEQRIWELDFKINNYGLRVDVPLIENIIKLVEQQKEADLKAFFSVHESLNVRPTQREKFKAWLKTQGFPLPNLTKATLYTFLQRKDLPQLVRDATVIYQSAGKTSLSKYPAMLKNCDSQGIIREIQQYHGAHTGRVGHRGVQWGNTARPMLDVKTICEYAKLSYETFAFTYDGRVTDALSYGIRGTVVSREEHKLVVGDLKQIEARVLCELAGQSKKIDKYRRNEDLYCEAATPIFGRLITKADKVERGVGKISELSLGFGGGIGAYAKMAGDNFIDLNPIHGLLWHTANYEEIEEAEKSYILHVKRCAETKKILKNGKVKEAREPVAHHIGLVCDLVKQRWRKNNKEVVALWELMEQTAIQAVENPGQIYSVTDTGVKWFMDGCFLKCRLPSGRDLSYPFPRIEYGKKENTKPRLEYMIDDKDRGGWVIESTYGGKLVENVVQAIARDILFWAALRLDQLGYTLVLSVHDELVADVPLDFGSVEEFESVMSEPLEWLSNAQMPIGADVWSDFRYDKRG